MQSMHSAECRNDTHTAREAIRTHAIGCRAVASAGSVVTKDVPDFAVVAGNPAVNVKYTD